MPKHRKITANYVFTLNGDALKNGIVCIDQNGTIVEIIKRDNVLETEGVEYYNGILCPGFVNAHCHLELSHLKNAIEPGKGLANFLSQLFFKRGQPELEIEKAIRQADQFMYKNGIVAVADISNSSLTLATKENSKIHYHTFIEVFGFHPQRAERAYEYANFLSHLFTSSKQMHSITPHASYSTSEELFALSTKEQMNKFFSIHHLESDSEKQLFANCSGPLMDHYSTNLKIDTSFCEPKGLSPLMFILNFIEQDAPLLLVHNTFMTQEDCSWLQQNRLTNNTYLVTCPRSNLFIEKQLPSYELLINSGFPICIGTDSLASNNTLSILEELKIIQQNLTSITINELLTWACTNGAKALGISDNFGSIEIGKQPGINLISNIDFRSMQLTDKSTLIKLV